jgi:hypothetical protein
MPSIVILGSFRKDFAGIAEKVRESEALGIVVLSPGRTDCRRVTKHDRNTPSDFDSLKACSMAA